MPVETLGEAKSYGWRVTARCDWGKRREGLKSKRECVYSQELDLDTLVWTRGAAFPLSDLRDRLKCPMCGSRAVRLIFSVPGQPSAARATNRSF
jgi:hypothetical protein